MLVHFTACEDLKWWLLMINNDGGDGLDDHDAKILYKLVVNLV